MVKKTQKICRLLPTNCLSVFDHFVRCFLTFWYGKKRYTVSEMSLKRLHLWFAFREWYGLAKHFLMSHENYYQKTLLWCGVTKRNIWVGTLYEMKMWEFGKKSARNVWNTINAFILLRGNYAYQNTIFLCIMSNIEKVSKSK